MNYANVISKISKALVRRAKPIDMGSFQDIDCITRNFGFDRGLPVDRYYIGRFLEMNRALIHGEVLEVAERTYATTYGDKNVRSWILNYSSTDVVRDVEALTITGDLTNETSIPSLTFDCFICTQTLNSIFELNTAVTNIRRLLKPGGAALVTLPSLTQITSYDNERWGDFWRFTPASARRLFSEVFCHEGDSVDVVEFGNLTAAITLLRGAAVEDLPETTLLDKVDSDYPVLTAVVVRKGKGQY